MTIQETDLAGIEAKIVHMEGAWIVETLTRLIREVRRLQTLVGAPEIYSFTEGVYREAAHQRERWGSTHDAGKAPSDWFWLVGYLAGKALAAHIAGNVEKALHHTISTAAALCNWHAAILGKTDMQPGQEAAAARAEGNGS